MSQSEFELLPSRPTLPEEPTPSASMAEADQAAGVLAVEPRPWRGRCRARERLSGFDGKPKDDFSMDGNIFTGSLGLDYRVQPTVL